MRVFAVIVGLLAIAFGGGCLMLADNWNSWSVALLGWAPLFAGGGLASYAGFRGGATPFPRAARVVVWLMLFGFAAYLVFILYVLANIH